MFVCLSVRSHNSKTARPNFTLRTSGFVDDVTFSYNWLFSVPSRRVLSDASDRFKPDLARRKIFANGHHASVAQCVPPGAKSAICDRFVLVRAECVCKAGAGPATVAV